LLQCSKDQWWSEGLRRAFSATPVITNHWRTSLALRRSTLQCGNRCHPGINSEAEQRRNVLQLSQCLQAHNCNCAQTASDGVDGCRTFRAHLLWLVNLCTSLALHHIILPCEGCWHMTRNSEAKQQAQHTANLTMPSNAQLLPTQRPVVALVWPASAAGPT